MTAVVECAYPMCAQWKALLAAANRHQWARYRRVVCGVLGVSPNVTDTVMIVAAQRDRRSAEQLAGEYLRRAAGVRR